MEIKTQTFYKMKGWARNGRVEFCYNPRRTTENKKQQQTNTAMKGTLKTSQEATSSFRKKPLQKMRKGN